MAEPQASERDRRFFRIQERAYFSYRLLTEAAAAAPPSARDDDDPIQDLPDKLSQLSHEWRAVFRKLSKDNPEAAAAVALLDKKLNLLATALLSQNLIGAGQSLVEISLSASGVGFFSPEPLPKDAPLEVTLCLPPTLYKIVARGKAVYCRQKEDGARAGQYWIGVDFNALSERDQEFLSGHVLKKQAEDIKQQRERETAPT